MSVNYWAEKEIGELISDVSNLKDADEVERLFEIILTPREINDMAKRLKVRKLLEEGRSYMEIATELRVSPVIISRISGKIGFGFRRVNAVVTNKIQKIKIKSPKEPAATSYRRFRH